jgi:hypothetical protein
MTPTVPGRIDVLGRRRAAGSVEVVGDRLWAPAACGVQVEDLGDHDGLLGLGCERHAVLAHVAFVAARESVQLALVAVRRASAGPEALLGRFAHPALGLASQLVPLELVPELLHADEQRPLGGVWVACAGGVVDRYADLAQLALVEGGDEPVAGEAAGGVDDDGVEPAGVAVAGFVGERAPSWAVLLGSGLLVGELAQHLSGQLRCLPLACLQL